MGMGEKPVSLLRPLKLLFHIKSSHSKKFRFRDIAIWNYNIIPWIVTLSLRTCNKLFYRVKFSHSAEFRFRDPAI